MASSSATISQPSSPESVRDKRPSPEEEEQQHAASLHNRKRDSRRTSWRSVLSNFVSPQSSTTEHTHTSTNPSTPTTSTLSSSAIASAAMASSSTPPRGERTRTMSSTVFSSSTSVPPSPSSSMTLSAPNPPLGSPSPKRQRTLKTSLRSRFSFRGKTNQLNPLPGEVPLAVLRVQVVSCKGLYASDRNGKSDPYVVLKLLQQRHRTPVIKSNLNPKWSAKDATFDFPIYGSIIERVAPIFEFVVWDKDLLGKDYLGEISLVMQDWFKDRTAKSFDDPNNIIRSFDLQSSRRKPPAQGSIQLLLGFAQPPESTKTINVTLIYTQLFDRALSSSGGMDVLSAPPTQGVGTVDRDSTLDDGYTADEHGIIATQPNALRRTLSQMSQEEKHRFRASWAGQGGEYNFTADQDIHGVVLLEITSASDLPKLKNVLTRDGWDNDPFVVVAFSDKIFRTRVIRHELNPVWEEKLVFRVRKQHLQDPNAQIHLSVLDWDKVATNDHVGDAVLDLSMLLNDENVPQPDKETGLYPDGGEVATTMKVYKIPLKPGKDAIPDSKHPPVITVRAKFQPHDAMRQRFWRQQLKQVDTNHSKKIARREIMNMAHALNMNLDKDDVDRFFKERGAIDAKAEVTIEEMIAYLENVIMGRNVPYPKTALPPPPSMGDDDGASVTVVEEGGLRSREVSTDEGHLEKDLTGSTGSMPKIIEPLSEDAGNDSEDEVLGQLHESGVTIPSESGDSRPPSLSSSLEGGLGGTVPIQRPGLQIPSASKRNSSLSPLIEVPTPLTSQPPDESRGRERSVSPRDQILHGRNRKSIGDLHVQLTEIFEAHPECTRNDLGTPQVPARAIIDILATFSQRHGVMLLNEDEAEQLGIITAANPDIPITTDLIMEFIAKSTGSVPPVPSPSPPKSRSPASPMLKGARVGGEDGGHSSASETDVSEQEDGGDTKRVAREPPTFDSGIPDDVGEGAQTDVGADTVLGAPFGAEDGAGKVQREPSGDSIRGPPSPVEMRNRTRPLHDGPPSTWTTRTPESIRRRRSDGGVGTRAMSDSESPSPRKVDRNTGRARAPSDAAADQASSGYSLGAPQSRSVPSLPLQQEADWLFTPDSSFPSSFDSAMFRTSDFGSPLSSQWSRKPSGGRLPLHLGESRGDPSKASTSRDHAAESPEGSDEEDPDDETMNLSLIRPPPQPPSQPSTTTLEEVESLQRANQDLTKKLQESGKTLEQRLEDHEKELEEYQTRLEDVKEELATTKREEKELRTKERAGSSQLAILEAEVSKLQKSLDSSRAVYSGLQKQYQEQCTESEKYRNILRRKDEEFKDAQEDATSQLNEVRKFKQDREQLEGAFTALQAELVAANQIQDELEEQSRQNDILKETIDRLRFDLDELRTAAAAAAAQAAQAAAAAAASATSATTDDGSSLAREVGKLLRETDVDVEVESDEEGDDDDYTEGDDDDYMETIITTSRRRKVGRGGNKTVVKVSKPKEYASAWTQHEESEFVAVEATQTDPLVTVDFAASAAQTDEIVQPVPVVQDFGAQTDEERTLADSEEEREEPVASSSHSPPPSSAPNLKGKERDLEGVMELPDTFDEQPPSYSPIHDHDHATVSYAEDFLRKWHPGLGTIGGVAGGLHPSSSRDWRNIKKEINFECLVIDKVIKASSLLEDDEAVEVEEDEDEEEDVRALDIPAGAEWIPGTPSFVAYPLMLVFGFGVVIFLSAARFMFPVYGSGGLTYNDRRMWNIYNTLSTNGFEGIIHRPPFLRGSIERIWLNVFNAVAGMPEARFVPT